MAIREGAWDCAVCGRNGNRGPEKHCAGCGHPRGLEVALYLPADAPEVSDADALERARAGPDWSCGFCGGDNRADYAHCTGCGAPGEGGPTRDVVVHRTAGAADDATPETRRAATQRRPDRARRRELKRSARSGAKKSRGCLAVGCLGLLALVAILAFLGRSSEITATVSGFAWERTLEIEARATVTEEAEADKVPQGARLLDSPQAGTGADRIQVGTERVKVGVRDLGNGYFEDVYEDRPVYQTVPREVPARGPPSGKVRYQVERWQTTREARESGSDRSPRWPRVPLAAGEREGRRKALYTVFFTTRDGDRVTYRIQDEELWRSFEPGGTYRVEATRGGRVKAIRGR